MYVKMFVSLWTRENLKFQGFPERPPAGAFWTNSKRPVRRVQFLPKKLSSFQKGRFSNRFFFQFDTFDVQPPLPCSKFSVYNHTKKYFSTSFAKVMIILVDLYAGWKKLLVLWFTDEDEIKFPSCSWMTAVLVRRIAEFAIPFVPETESRCKHKPKLDYLAQIQSDVIHISIRLVLFCWLLSLFLLQFRTPEGAAQKKVERERKVFVTIQMWRKWENWQSRCGEWCFKGKPKLVFTRETVSRRLLIKLVKWVFLARRSRVSGPVCVCIMVCELLAKYLMKVKADKHWTWNLMNI